MALGHHPDGAQQEADGAQQGARVVQRGVQQVAGRRLHPTRDRGDPEQHGAEQVDRGDPPAQVTRPPGDPAVSDLGVGQLARHQEADRAQRIRRPHDQVLALGGQPLGERIERREVEEDRADELDRGRPPVDASRLDGEPAATAAAVRRRADALDELQVGRRGEEDRADEVGHRVGAEADQRRVARHGAEDEAERADREQRGDPPTQPARRPIGAAGAPPLAVAPRAPLPATAVGQLVEHVRGERSGAVLAEDPRPRGQVKRQVEPLRRPPSRHRPRRRRPSSCGRGRAPGSPSSRWSRPAATDRTPRSRRW